MSDTNHLSPAPPERLSMNYAALRESGMEHIRLLASATWTDHNAHDPGITLLEAFCYAMTELGFRIQQEMPDLLRSGETYALPNLEPAHRVLPVAPITAEDLRRVLLDHHLVSEAWITPGAASEVPFYTAGNRRSFTYTATPTTELVSLRGLYEVKIAFAKAAWNSNTYTVSEESSPYTLEIALPHWDDPEAIPFREGKVRTVDGLAMQPLGQGPWRALDATQSYFGKLTVTFTASDNITSTQELWVVLRITNNLNQPSVELSATAVTAILSDAATALVNPGVDGIVHQFIERVRASYGGALQMQRYIEQWRNLCEAPVRLLVARQQEIAIRARIEVTGSTNLEQLLAEIFLAIDLALSPPLVFAGLEDRQAAGDTSETLYDGPLLRHGFWLDPDTEPLARDGKIYTSDILRLIMQQRSPEGSDLVAQENPTGRDIIAVTDLALSNFVNNRPITTSAQDCLTLVDIDNYRPRLSVTKSRITFVRNDLDIPHDQQRVKELFQDLRQQQTANRAQTFSPSGRCCRAKPCPSMTIFPSRTICLASTE
jgi:hypothetical protein